VNDFNSFASQGVSGTLFFQGQRLFFHNATGKYGSIPLTISGDMDINPDDGEYRLSCQVSFLTASLNLRSLVISIIVLCC